MLYIAFNCKPWTIGKIIFPLLILQVTLILHIMLIMLILRIMLFYIL